MAQKFKCINCGQIFTSDENDSLCPNCKSDNITPLNRPRFLIWIVIVLAAVAAAIGGFLYFRGGEGTVQEQEPVDEALLDIQPPTGEEGSSSLTKTTMPYVINDLIPQLCDDGTYSLSVFGKVDSGDALRYEIYALGETVPRYVSDNGFFNRVCASPAEDGIYTVSVVNRRTGDKYDKIVIGFLGNPSDVEPAEGPTEENPVSMTSDAVKPKVNAEPSPIEKLPAAELQKIFNSGTSSSSLKNKFARGYTLHFSGLEPGEPAPDRYEEIFNRLICAWTSVNVLDVEYNSLNLITSVKIKVNQ